MKYIATIIGILTFGLGILQPLQAGNDGLSLWYKKPAKKWEQGLPLGNGRLGMVVYGGVDNETLVFNEDSLWSGWFEKGNDREGAYAALQKTRELIKRGASQAEIKKSAMEFCSHHGYGKKDFGAYQSFCNAIIKTGHDPAKVKNYRRALDLTNAVASVRYSYEGTRYEREYFSSYPAQASVIRYTADEAGAIDLTISLASLHKNSKVTVDGHTLVIDGAVDVKEQGAQGMKFQARLYLTFKGGMVNVQGTSLKVTGSDEITMLMMGATNYRLSYPDQYRGGSPDEKNKMLLAKLKGESYANLKDEHIKDYQRLFKRVELKLAGQDRFDLPTDERRQRYRKTKDDCGLENLTFQYGRYLMIACSRPGSMPANLQGLWNNSNSPAWTCDYHLNINFQMNYWPVDLCNLSECMEPVIRWTQDLQKAGQKTARIHYDSPGWVAHHTTNVWGFTSPGPARGVHMLEAESGAFLCQNIWDHYAFTGDKDYLRNDAWPLLKGAAEFWIANLQTSKEGHLVVSPAYSPEWGPLSDSSYYQTMIVWDLFDSCIKASSVLGLDNEFAAKLKSLKAKLQPLKIGKYGQLQEWRLDQLEEGINQKRHRHMSHMWALYPGHQIVASRDGKLARAAEQSMNFRGDGATGWSMGWKINIWARLLDGNRAHKLINHFIGSRVYDNLWCAHPPFQIDGNFGYTAGVAEMLLQSHAGVITLLPALPDQWSSGSVRGLKARTGVTVGMKWREGQIKLVELTSNVTQTIKLNFDGRQIDVDLPKGETVRVTSMQRK